MSRLTWIYSVYLKSLFFNMMQTILIVFRNFADIILSSAFVVLYELITTHKNQ